MEDHCYRGVAQLATEPEDPCRRGSPAIGEIAGVERLVRDQEVAGATRMLHSHNEGVTA